MKQEPEHRKLTPLEMDVFRYFATGDATRADGSPLDWGAAMGACIETLAGAGYIEKDGCAWFITLDGLAAWHRKTAS